MRWMIASLVVTSACASHTKLPEPVRASLSARHMGKTVELRQSVYYGDLYDENEKWLLSPHPFAETFHIVDLEGTPIHPRGEKGILPAGTQFVIERVEFPDATAMTMRMLTTPRYNTWIYLTPAPSNTSAPTGRKYFILLLPMDLESEAAVEQEFSKFVAPAGEVTAWLNGRQPTVKVAIEHKDVQPGMSLDEVVASLGEPQRWLNDTHPQGMLRVAWYPSRELWLKDDVVLEVRSARPLD